MPKPDFRTIAAGTRLYNFHSHTQYCDGRATVAEFAAAAALARFEHYGFSPHSPIPIASGCNMSEADVESYMSDIEDIRGKYAGRVEFYAGMEIDYLGPMWGPSHSYFQHLGLDYSIGSVHFIPDREGTLIDIDGNFERFCSNMKDYFHRDIRYVVETYFRHSLAMIEAGGFDILGHFDKVSQNASLWQPGIENEAWYERWIDLMFEAIKSSGVIVEINTKSNQVHGRLFPAMRHIPRLVESGAVILVNSDAHDPRLINASREYAFGVIDGLRMNLNSRSDSEA